MRTRRRSFSSAALLGVCVLSLTSSCESLTHSDPGPANWIFITPADTTVFVGDVVTLSAQAVDKHGRLLRSDDITWSADSPTVAVSTAGQFSASAIGRYTIRASAGTRSDSAILNVVPHLRILGAQSGNPAQLILIDTDGSHFRVVGPAPSGSRFTWMPNGADIMFFSLASGQGTIQVIDTLGAVRPFFPSGTPGVTSIADPTVSADGQWLYFLGKDSTIVPPDWGFYRARIDGTAPELVTRFTPISGTREISISPDGTRIALINVDNYAPNVALMDVATKDVTWPLAITSGGISWSPDGKHFGYDCLHCLTSALVWNAPGTTPPPRPEGYRSCCVAWSSDARYVLYSNWGQSDLTVYVTIGDVANGGSARLPSTATAYGILAFRSP